MQNNRFIIAATKISSTTIALLNTLLPFILAEFLWFAASFIFSFKIDPIKATNIYSPMIEYLMLSLLLTLAGGMLFDIALKEKK